MTQEEKAKAYDEALERMKSWVKGEYPECFTEAQKTAEFIFPELKESEDDRIRKAIMEFFELQDDNTTYSFISKKDILAWLEKQGKKDKLIKELGQYKVKYIQETLEKYVNSMSNKDDERLKKTTIAFLKDFAEQGYENAVECIDWLEKQGEKPQGKSALEAVKEEKVDNQNCVNPTDKNEPEFHGGEWVIYNHDICQIVKREEGCNKLVTVFGIEKELVNERNLSTAHLWTIQDAKDGDVLVCDEEILLFKSYSVQDRISLYCWYNGQTNNFHNKEVVDVLLTTRNKVCPATKEQRDLLFSKMKEAGYEWYAGKKELHKIKDELENYKQQLMSEITDLVEDYISQKPTWSEKDEKKLSDIISILRGEENCYYNSPILIDWLKSLKERIGG